MDHDIFEEMNEKLGCQYISDLRFRESACERMMQTEFFKKYPKQQRKDFCDYIFGKQSRERGDHEM